MKGANAPFGKYGRCASDDWLVIFMARANARIGIHVQCFAELKI